MRFHIMTLFPEMVEQGLDTSILGRAREKGLIEFEAINIRDYSGDLKHHKVDDYTYGGGAGMLMQAQPIYDCYKSIEKDILDKGGKAPRVVYVTPQGSVFNQKMAQELAQSRMYSASGKLPQSVKDYVNTTLWSNVIKPYTISREMSWLIYYYSLMAEEDDPKMQQNRTFDANTLLQMSEQGRFKASAEDLATIKKWQNMMEQYKKASPDEAKKIEEQNKELIEELNILMQRPDVEDIVNDYFDMIDIKAKFIDSVYQDPVLRDIAKGQLLCSRFVERKLPLNQAYMNVLSEIQLPAIRNTVLANNDKLLAIQQTVLPYPASLRPSSDVEGLTDGEAILRKILEPFKGRIVYLDIWGTWCGPCKEKLAESPYVKSQLKDFDIVYLYLANRSPEESWKNTIKEYDLTGENCVHYNLPAAQQRAVEEFLKVNSFPTYKLIDKRGNIHDLEWLHTSNMTLFKEILYRISSMQE